ncbi:hypothetical protein Afil01_06710 [Actinorhabdospora filicis]|uniref:Protein kinase domain-containing protein n=1 Tax=Actinorhabdospora filicis TaxID=1785913 RepID=A0A9W6SI19_9ACTN|nr:hypothetical protein [Actinorhabdospora filicis]GLZ75864.1 hypothetical protein Afil01_06710 [Actinorhabdospora filicis]
MTTKSHMDISAAGAVRLARLLHRDEVAAVFTGTLPEEPAPLVVTLGNERAVGARRTLFLDWAARVTRLSAHPHIATVHAVGLTGTARPYLAVQTTRTSLGDRLRAAGPLTPGFCRAIGVALADALATVHSIDLIHGAVHPATTLIGPGDQLLLAGLDATAPLLAQRPTRVSAYTAPEHIDAAIAGEIGASPAADVYDLATLLYGALGGRLQWLGTEGGRVTDPLLRAAPIADIPGVSRVLTDIIAVCLSADPRERPTAAQLRDALSTVDISAAPSPGRRPAAVAAELAPTGGPRPATAPTVTDLAVPERPAPEPPRQGRLGRTAKAIAVAALAVAFLGGASLATYAATRGNDTTMGCPTEDELSSVAVSWYGDGTTVTEKVCAADGYVAMTVRRPVPLNGGTGASAPATGVVRIAMHRVDGNLQRVDACGTGVPAEIRNYVAGC